MPRSDGSEMKVKEGSWVRGCVGGKEIRFLASRYVIGRRRYKAQRLSAASTFRKDSTCPTTRIHTEEKCPVKCYKYEHHSISP